MTIEEENLITNNIKMAYDISWKFYKRFKKYVEYDELQSESLVGLTKAAKAFRPELNLAFSTYAYKVMQNEMLLYLKQITKNLSTSIYTETCDELEIIDMLESDINIEEDMLNKHCISELYDSIDKLPVRLKNIIEYRLKGLTMMEIAKKLNLSQPQISRDYHIAINRLKSKLKHWR